MSHQGLRKQMQADMILLIKLALLEKTDKLKDIIVCQAFEELSLQNTLHFFLSTTLFLLHNSSAFLM